MRKVSFILSLVLLTFFVFGSSVILSDETQLEIGTAFGNDFYLYVTDPINDRVIMYDYDMNYLGVFFDKCDECPDWELGNPVAIATDRLLNCVIVTDTEKKHAFHVDFRGEPYWNQYESYRNEVLEPWDISACEIYDDIGNYAVDRTGNKLLRYDPPSINFDKNANECNVCCVLRFSVPKGYEDNPAPVGDGEGEFNNPEGLMVDRRGYVLVADTGNNRIQKFRRNGEFVIEFGGVDDDFQLNHPVDLVPDWNEDSPNRYYIVDQGNKRVVITDEYGKYINEIKPIRDDGESLFERINGISVDNRGDIWVTDSGNQSIYKFSSIDAKNSLELIGMIEDVLSKKSIKIREAVIPIMKFFTQINNKKVPIDPRAQIVNDRTMVPVRWLIENIYTQEEDDVSPIFAGDVQWDETTKKATLTLPKIDFGSGLVFESRVIELWQDNPIAKINGKSFPIDPENPNVTIKNIEDRLFVPLRFVSEAFDSKVSWTPKDEVPTSREGIVRISFPDYDYLDSKSAEY